MKFVGAHVSSSGGVENAPGNATQIGASALALFTRNQRTWKVKPLATESIAGFKRNAREAGLAADRVLPHASYLINLGSPDEAIARQSYTAFLDELQRCEQLGLSMLNFHPGSHRDQIPEDVCINQIAGYINQALEQTTGVTAVIENTAGQGGSVGHTFEQLRRLIDLIEDQSRVGICLDTCHAFAAGYDLRDAGSYQQTMDHFENAVGFGFLRGVHANDSKTAFESRVDRHERVGEGTMGLEAFRLLMNDPRFDDLPIILETPEKQRWAEEISLLVSLVQ